MVRPAAEKAEQRSGKVFLTLPLFHIRKQPYGKIPITNQWCTMHSFTVTIYGNTIVSDLNKKDQNPFSVKVELELSGGAIIHVTKVNQAKIVESAGACCVIVSEPSRPTSSISRMLDMETLFTSM
ncbi:hypothetical protein L1887_22820 [Cichorium endivia]|nr:hypothetical protein L1887_22820 [Cichorium endivia]